MFYILYMCRYNYIVFSSCRFKVCVNIRKHLYCIPEHIFDINRFNMCEEGLQVGWVVLFYYILFLPRRYNVVCLDKFYMCRFNFNLGGRQAGRECWRERGRTEAGHPLPLSLKSNLHM
jgi:hypothetical protein